MAGLYSSQVVNPAGSADVLLCAAERRLMVWPILHLKGPDVWFLVKTMRYHSTNLGAVMGPCSPSLWHHP